MNKKRLTVDPQPKERPNLSDPRVREQRLQAAERLIRNEEARRRQRRLSARTA